MKVKCISEKLDNSQLNILGDFPSAKNHYSITIGKEYVVFGISFSFSRFGNGCFVQVLSDYNHLINVPIALFDLVDKRSSKFWEFKVYDNQDVAFWPPSFYREFYHDDLSEDIPEVVENFKLIKEQILKEFD